MAPPSSPFELTRRVAVLGTVAAAASACTPFSLDLDAEPSEPRPKAPPRTDPDVDLAAAVLAAEQSMVDLVDATLAAHPRLERVLAQTRSVHLSHVTLLDDAAPPEDPPDGTPDDATSGSASPTTPSPTGTESEAPRRVPRDRGRALRLLANAEDDLSLSNKQSAFAAKSGSFARVLASMAAASAQQAAVLRAARATGGAG